MSMKYIRVIVKLQVGQRQWKVVNGGIMVIQVLYSDNVCMNSNLLK